MDWRLALITFSVLAAHRCGRPMVPQERARIISTSAALGGAYQRVSQRAHQRLATVQLFRREAYNYARFNEINASHRDANVEQIFY
jgi:hypothetical protein